MSKNAISLTTLILVALIFTTPVMASRVLVVPTGDTLAPGEMEIDYTFHRSAGVFSLSMGVYPGLDLGLRQNLSGNTSGALKFSVFNETQNSPALAIGGEASPNGGHLFAVLSKQLGTPVVRGHVGLGLSERGWAMAGLTAVLNPVQIKTANKLMMPTTSLFLEYDGIGLNGGLIAQFNPNLKARVGLASDYGLSVGFNCKVSF